MPKQEPASVETALATIREEFTTLNILVQALNRELRDGVFTTLAEVKRIGRALRIAPVYGRSPSTKRTKRRA